MLVMNYFKFSLYNGNENINPNNDLVKYQTPDKNLRKQKYNVIKVGEIYIGRWGLIQRV